MSERYLVDENKNLVAYEEPTLGNEIKTIIKSGNSNIVNFVITSEDMQYSNICFLCQNNYASGWTLRLDFTDPDFYSGVFFMKVINGGLRDRINAYDTSNLIDLNVWYMFQTSNMTSDINLMTFPKTDDYWAYLVIQLAKGVV